MKLTDIGITGVDWDSPYFPSDEQTMGLFRKRSEQEALTWLSAFWLFSNAQVLLAELAPLLAATEAELEELEQSEQACIAESHREYKRYQELSRELQDKRRPMAEQEKLELAKQKANAGWRGARSRGEQAAAKQGGVRKRLARMRRLAEMLEAIPKPAGGPPGLAELLGARANDTETSTEPEPKSKPGRLFG